MKLRRLAALFCTLSLLPATGAVAERLTETERVIAIEVPVQVIVDGRPVKGLDRDSFEVRVKGKKHEIVGFQEIDLSAIVPGPQGILTQDLAPAARRHILFLFDLTFAGAGSVVRARRAVTGAIDQLHASDLAAVATYSVTKGSRIVLGFTTDRGQLRAAIETLGVPDLVQGSLDPLGVTLVEPRQMTFGSGAFDVEGVTANSQRQRDLGIDDAVAQHLAELQQDVERATRRSQQQQITALTRDFAGLAGLMNSVQGRKYVVYLSEGFDTSGLFASRDAGEVARMNQAAASGELWNVDSDARFGNTTSQSFVDSMLEEFRRANCVIQSIDVGAAGGDDDPRGGRSGTDGLFLMANETGGEFYRNYNDIGEALSAMLQKTSVQYALTIQPRDLEPDGSYHKLKVKLVGGPKGARLVHRPGFYAPKPLAEQSGRERQLSTAGLVLSGPEQGTLPVRVLAAPFRTAGDAAVVPVLIEVDGPALLDGQRDGTLPAEVYGYVLDPEGGIRDLFASQFAIDVGRFGEALSRGGLKFYGDLDLAPGSYTLRLLVRNGESGELRVRHLPLEVSGTGGPASLLPPLFPDAPDRWLLVRETPREGETPVFPFSVDGEPYLPGTRPVLVPGRPRSMVVVGYGLGAGAEVRARLRGGGDAVRELSLGELARVAGATPGADTLQAAVSPDGVPPGEYELEVTVRDAGTGRELTSSIPVLVTTPPAS